MQIDHQARWREKFGGAQSEALSAARARLEAGEPIEYILGEIDFLGVRIDLSLKPMIPRFETAFWVAAAIEQLKTLNRPLRLADTFAGAGNVGLALLVHLPETTVEFFELDPALKKQIEINLALNKIPLSRARVETASDLTGLTGLYDAIFAVPPYVPYSALPDLDPEMRDFEPHLAFFAEENGHYFHRILIKNAHRFLKPGGTLFMEADFDHNAKIRELVANEPWRSLEFWPDPYGATPNVILRR